MADLIDIWAHDLRLKSLAAIISALLDNKNLADRDALLDDYIAEERRVKAERDALIGSGL